MWLFGQIYEIVSLVIIYRVHFELHFLQTRVLYHQAVFIALLIRENVLLMVSGLCKVNHKNKCNIGKFYPFHLTIKSLIKVLKVSAVQCCRAEL